MPTKYVTAGAHRIHYFHTGATTLPDVPPNTERGELLLFLHGAGWNGALWQKSMSDFAEEHSPLALDFPGHGRSTGIDGLRSIDEYRDCLADFIEALRLRPAVLVGHGLGGAAALAYAIFHPQRVRGLVLTGTAARFQIPAEQLDTWRNVMRGRRAQPFTNEGFAALADPGAQRAVLSEQIKTDPRVRYMDLVLSESFEVTPWLEELKLPVLIINGVEDPYAPPERARALRDGITGAELVIVEGAGHYVPWERRGAFETALRQFLVRLEGQT